MQKIASIPWATLLLVLGFLGPLAPEALATPSISRNEIMARAFSARYTPYGQTGSHVKSYFPESWASEPVIDCSGLVQKSWQVPEQIYPGDWPPSKEYDADSLDGNGDHWYTINQGSMVRGDALSSGSHAVLYVYTGALGRES